MLPTKSIAILEALATYKFLTRLQLARIGVEIYSSALSKYCKPLAESKIIGVIDASGYGIGYVYYLTKKGGQFISRELGVNIEEVHYCASPPKLTSQTLHHRTHAIDCQIELFDSCKKASINIEFYHRDIESLGNIRRSNNLSRKTRVPLSNGKYLEPDAIFMLSTPRGKKLYCLEFEHKDYTKKSYEKSLKHIEALNIKSPSKKYDHPKAHRTLFIYHNASTKDAVMDLLAINTKGLKQWFLFKSFDEIRAQGKFTNSKYSLISQSQFLTGWSTISSDKKISIF